MSENKPERVPDQVILGCPAYQNGTCWLAKKLLSGVPIYSKKFIIGQNEKGRIVITCNKGDWRFCMLFGRLGENPAFPGPHTADEFDAINPNGESNSSSNN